MTHRVIWEDIDGSIKQTIPSPQWLRDHPNANLATDLPGVSPNATQKAVIADADAPSDRTFRGAWKWDGRFSHKCGVDLDKAKHIAADRVREVRAKVFERTDAEFMIALEKNDTPAKNAAVAKKEFLRAAPDDTRIANAADVDALKAGMANVISDVEAL